MSHQELKELLIQFGQPAYREKQLFKWLHKGIKSFDEASDLPKALRSQLEEACYIANVEIERRLVSQKDDTKKYLFRLRDGEYIEAVLMKYKHGWSECISTQVGCRMGCTFCATGKEGMVRNLTASEILSQITAVQEREDVRVSNIVLMGMGEPLDNYYNVLRFLELLSDSDGICIGQRHVSLSTCGLVDRIKDLEKLNLQITLSVSLHAPNDEIRRSMMPVAKRWSVDELLEACKSYANTTGRRISYEYSLVSGVNDSDECATELAQRLRGTLCHVNLIPVNRVEGSGCFKPSSQRTERFRTILEQMGITATVRRTLGSDINASCGQLRRANKGK